MLHIKDLTYRIAGRVLFEDVNAHLPRGHHVGLVGRNGTGKSTLFKLILKEVQADQGSVLVQKGARVGIVAQEVPVGTQTPLEFVLEGDQERHQLLQELEASGDPMRLADVHHRLNEIDAYSAPARAAKILVGLGFSEPEQHQPLSSYSGGWRMRVALAAALFSEPDLLLLDEPTNHLDLESVAWLEGFLKSYPHTLVIISHDRHVLNNVVDRIYHLHDKKISLYMGNYDFYEKTRREQMLIQQAAQTKQQAARSHIQSFVDRFRAKASKARQVQSRIKMLERFEPLSMLRDDPALRLKFPQAEDLAPPLMTLNKVSAGYEDKVILKDLNQRIDQEDRIALLGSNGNGKSTFAKLVAGAISPLSGELYRSEKLNVAYFHQHQIEALHVKETAFQHLSPLMKDSRPDQVRARLGQFGFAQEKADVMVEKLSGGEKARLNFALISAKKPQLLILDEPTNHLDVETRDALVVAINDFAGAVILITHDWHLLELTVDRLWLVANQKVEPFDGDLEDYRRFILGGKADKGSQKAPSLSRADEIKAKKQAKKSKNKDSGSNNKKK